ncbi:1,2-phenylacetyl-CoA epoxidase subunit PaaC [Halobacterium zhouii]|uniref:1,2-phenylacetyl-CoA epoxidase subunit PaaC n=1 Tax=Halobacterium zhouii TaxID=2902624 RepID=UPI001E5949CF|nr:1,2-phenylacetyl-CoA epoxidase subunit PaaC [Halobacterium zhouii]
MADATTDQTAVQQDAVEAELRRLADDEFVLAERYTEWQIYAPTVESDLALANIAQDEFGHARLWYDLLQDEFGYEERDLLWERDPADFVHSPLVELETPEGDWADTIVRSYLYDVAERLRLDALADSSYGPIAERVPKVVEEEEYHREHAQSWLDRMTGSGESHERVQDALDRLFPYALTLFEAGAHEDDIVETGVRTRSLDELREDWLDEVVSYLESLDLDVPDPDDTGRPDVVGRDGSHTDAWVDLYEAFTATYRELDFENPVRLRGEGE